MKYVLTLLCLLLCANLVSAQDYHNTVPLPGVSFPSQLQEFLKEEDADRYADQFGRGFVSVGGIHGTSVTRVSPSFALRGYVNSGFMIDQASTTIDYEDYGAALTDECWVIAHKLTTGNVDTYIRVPNTHFLVDCGTNEFPGVPADSTPLMKVKMVDGAITDVRGLFPTNAHNPGRIYGTDPYIGMLCDGHTDDSAALQRAVDLSTDRGGVGIELPAGTCVVKEVTITNNDRPGGIDDDDARMGCASIYGQGAGKTILTPPDDVAADEYVLIASCTPLGAGHFANPYPGNYPGGVTLRDFSIYGRQNRQLESHGLLAEGGHFRADGLNIQSINGMALHIGKDEKMESGWFAFLHIRHSGRYVTDGGRNDGLPGSSNEPAVLFDEPTNGQNSNNISFYGLQLGFNWYTSVEMDCEPESFNSNIFFYAGMYHNNESPDNINQGRLNTDTGLFWLHGNCFNIAFHGANANAPGSDAADTDDVNGAPVAVFHLDDIEGPPAATGPDSVWFADIYGNQSCCGQLFRITAARAVTLHGIRAGTNNDTDYPDGQLVVVPAPDIEVDEENPPEGNDQLALRVCNSLFDPELTSIYYKDVEKIIDCGRSVYSRSFDSDTDRRKPEWQSATFLIGATGTVDKAHTMECTPGAQHFTINFTGSPGACGIPWIHSIDADSYSISCGANPGGGGAPGIVQIFIPEGCTTAALLTLSETPVATSMHRNVYIHGITLTSQFPGTTNNANDYATFTLMKRMILSQVPFAHLTTKTTGLPSWTPVPFTIDDMSHLVWEPGESLVLVITKSCDPLDEDPPDYDVDCDPVGAGASLAPFTVTIQIGTNVLANRE